VRGHLLVPRASAAAKPAASFPLPPLVLCQSQPVTTLHARLHAVHSGQLTGSPAVQDSSTRGERVPFALTLSLNPSPSVSSALGQAATSDWRLDMASCPTSRVPALHCTSAPVRVVVTRRTGTAPPHRAVLAGADLIRVRSQRRRQDEGFLQDQDQFQGSSPRQERKKHGQWRRPELQALDFALRLTCHLQYGSPSPTSCHACNATG